MPAVQTRGGLISCGDEHAAADRKVRINGEPIVVVGDLSVGHAGFPPTPAIEGSSRILVNGTPVVCFGHLYADHSDGEHVHTNRRGVQLTKVLAG